MCTFRLPALLVLIAVGLVSCATTPTPSAQDPLDPAAIVEMMRLAQPGPEHEELAKYVGEWDGKTSFMMAPDTPPMSMESSATCRMILGGRFLEMESKGSFMEQPFESVGMFGFDRRNGVWTTVGFDSHGTYWVSGAGKRDKDGVIRMHGRDEDPMGEQVFFFEIRFVSDDEFVSSVYFSKQGPQTFDPPFKMVETRYTRRKP